MATLNWPGFGLASISPTLDQPSQSNSSAWTGTRTVIANPWHGKWSFRVTLATRQGDAAFQAARAFFTSLKGQINTFHLPAVEAPQNGNTGVTLSANAAQGATSIALTGVTTALVAGNMVTLAGQLLSLTSAGSLSGTAQTVNFQPSLRAAASSGASVETAKPYALVYLADSKFTWDIGSWRRYGLTFDATEAVGETDGADPALDVWGGGTGGSGGGGTVFSFPQLPSFISRSLLAAVTSPSDKQVAYLTEAGREGEFVFSTANLSAKVTIDTAQGVYVAPAADTTGTSGAWVRKFSGSVTPQMFGGTNPTAAQIQAAWSFAFANSIPCHNPGGNYAIGASLVIDVDGWQLSGDGWENTRFIPTGAFPAIIVKARFGKAVGIGCWGNGVGTYGWIFKNAGGSEIISCQGREFTIDGALIDPTYGGGAAGNNNCLKFRAGGYNANGAIGVRMAQHLDNNDIGFLGIEASANASHGLLAKSSKPYVSPDCIFEGNGGYGVLLGEDADGSTNLDAKIDEPWIEANTLGGVRGSASSSNGSVKLMSQGQSYTRHASALNCVNRVTGGGLFQFASADGVAFVQANASAADAYLKAASASGGNVNMSIGRAGTGYVALLGRTQIVDDGDTFAEFNIRPDSTKSGVLTFTHPGVADRWGIGIKTGDSNLYFGDRTLGTIWATLSNAGAFIVTSLKVGANQVVGARQTGTPADATDLATALTLVNDLKTKLIAHGLIS